jgi:proline iminopeptidase
MTGTATAVTGPKPDTVTRVPVEGGEVVAYVYGERSAPTILAINGGPGVASVYLREGFADLVRRGFRLVTHDQLGTGASDRPDDPSLWTLRRYVAEVEAVRRVLCPDRVHLLGHSWGGWLGTEYAVTHPERLASVIFSNTAADMAVHLEEIRRLLGAFGAETLAMVDRMEAEGRLDHPEYRAICTLFYGRHSSRKAHLGDGRKEEAGRVNMQIQRALWGPAEFSANGELAGWSRLGVLARVTEPALVLVGAYDYLTPRSAGLIHAHLPDSRLVLFPESGHAPHLDEPEAYFATIETFVRSVA